MTILRGMAWRRLRRLGGGGITPTAGTLTAFQLASGSDVNTTSGTAWNHVSSTGNVLVVFSARITGTAGNRSGTIDGAPMQIVQSWASGNGSGNIVGFVGYLGGLGAGTKAVVVNNSTLVLRDMIGWAIDLDRPLKLGSLSFAAAQSTLTSYGTSVIPRSTRSLVLGLVATKANVKPFAWTGLTKIGADLFSSTASTASQGTIGQLRPSGSASTSLASSATFSSATNMIAAMLELLPA